MSITIEAYDSRLHLRSLSEALSAVHAEDPTYPPPRVQKSVGGMHTWLMAEAGLGRWVAVSDGRVVGHVMAVPAHSYLTDFFLARRYASRANGGFVEIARLFVHPLFQRQGIASTLLRTGIDFAWSVPAQPVLAVVDTSTAAIRLYEESGLIRLGSFAGVDGVNVVMVDEDPSV